MKLILNELERGYPDRLALGLEKPDNPERYWRWYLVGEQGDTLLKGHREYETAEQAEKHFTSVMSEIDKLMGTWEVVVSPWDVQ